MAKLWTTSFISMALANLFMATAFYFLLPNLPIFATQELGASKGEVGIILACFTLSAMVIRPFGGILIDRHHRRKLFVLFYVLFASLFGLYLLANSFQHLLLLRMVHGLFWGLLTTASATLIVDILPISKRGEGLGIYGLGMPLGMALGPFLSTVILKHSNFHTVFFIALCLALTGWLFTFKVQSEKHLVAEKSKILSFDSLFEKRVLPVFVPQLCLSFIYSGIISFAPLFDHENTWEVMGTFFLILAVSSLLPRFFAGRVYDKEGPKRLVTTALILQLIGLSLLAGAIYPWMFLASASFLGMSNGTMWPTFQAMVNDLVPPEKRGAANSTYFNGFDLGMGIGALSLGVVADLLGLRAIFIIALPLLVIAGAIIWIWTFKVYEAKERGEH